MKHKPIVLIFLLLITFITNAQEHEHHRLHVGVGTGAVFIPKVEIIAAGFHIHLMKSFKHESNFSYGLGYEVITSDQLHQEITAFIGYYLAKNLTIEAGPGLTFEKINNQWETGISGHVECSYEFQLGSFHLGPMIGCGVDREDFHTTLGIHFGFGF